jgi:hypothetical protein
MSTGPTNDLSEADAAAQRLKQRLTGSSQQVTDADDRSRLSQAVTLAVKTASRLRKAVVDAAELRCSAANAAVLAHSLEGAASVLESTGGLTSAAGQVPPDSTFSFKLSLRQ